MTKTYLKPQITYSLLEFGGEKEELDKYHKDKWGKKSSPWGPRQGDLVYWGTEKAL